MALKIMVMSPLHNLGTSVVSTMLAQGVTFNNKTSTLLYTRDDTSLPKYLGIEGLSDPTRSVMQIVKLIDNGAIQDKDILDYTYKYATNAYLLNTSDKSISDKDKQQVLTHVYTRTPSDVVVLDNSEDIISPITKSMIELSDVVFIVVQPGNKSFERLKVWLTYTSLKDKENVYVIVNNYNEVIFSARDMAKFIGLPACRVGKLHYNPWITKCCINGKLQTILPLAMDLDARVSNLSSDIKAFNACINSEMFMSTRRDD